MPRRKHIPVGSYRKKPANRAAKSQPGPGVPARYVRHSEMCSQLDVSDRNDNKRKICPTKLDASDKKTHKICPPELDMSDNNYFVFLFAFS